MTTKTQNKGLWLHRFAIHFFTFLLTILFFWVLGFLVRDIETIKGPDFEELETKHLDPDLQKSHEKLKKEAEELSLQIKNLKEKQSIVQQSSQNLQQTINQLLEIKRIELQKNQPQQAIDAPDFSNSLNVFLENQKKYQEYSLTIAERVEQEQNLQREIKKISDQLEAQRKTAWKEFETLHKHHRLKLAFLQLAILLPLLAVASFFILRKRKGLYFPIYLAFGIATLLKVGLVLHEYFPGRYFKYILIGALLLVVTKLLIYFIRLVAFPKMQALLRQYRDAYEKFLCPICEYPIRTGPRRFLYWTRRSLAKSIVHTHPGDQQEEIYTCPHCGQALYEECPVCHKVRAALLPFCSHCGTQKNLEENQTEAEKMTSSPTGQR